MCSRVYKQEQADTEQLLSRIPLPAVRAVTTTFKLHAFFGVCSMVTLLHLAAYWGWGNVVTALVSVYYCAANSKDSKGQIPLHYAAYNGHLEVVKYFTAQLALLDHSLLVNPNLEIRDSSAFKAVHKIRLSLDSSHTHTHTHTHCPESGHLMCTQQCFTSSAM